MLVREGGFQYGSMVVTLVSDRAWTQHAKPSVQIFGIIFSSRQIIRFEKFHVVWVVRGLGLYGYVIFISFLCNVYREELV